jgi:hypothetical protein
MGIAAGGSGDLWILLPIPVMLFPETAFNDFRHCSWCQINGAHPNFSPINILL